MDSRTSGIVARIAHVLGEFPEVRRSVLFGSRARGDNLERSDVDIAIEAPGAGPECWTRIVEAVDEVPTLLRIDIVRWETASAALKREIERDGVELGGIRTHAA